MKALWMFTIIATFIAGGILVVGYFVTGVEMPTLVACCALAIIPYCFARACEHFADSEEAEQLVKLNDQVAVQTKLLASIANSQEERAA